MLLSNGDLYGCGSNEFGQLGFSKVLPKLTKPTRVCLCVEMLSSSLQEQNRCTCTTPLHNHTESCLPSTNFSEELSFECLAKKRKITNDDLSNFHYYCCSHSGCKVIRIKCAYDYTVIQTGQGLVFATGDNEYQQLLNSKECDRIYKFTLVNFKGIPEEDRMNLADLVLMDSYILALTKSGKLYMSEGDKTFEKIGLDIEYFHTEDYPNNAITQIFKTSYAFFIKTRMGEIFFLQQGIDKMVKSKVLSYKNFLISSGRYHVVSISKDPDNYGMYEVIGFNKYGNLGLKTLEETLKAPTEVTKVSNWVRSNPLHYEYKLSADYFNTFAFRIYRPQLVAQTQFFSNLFESIDMNTKVRVQNGHSLRGLVGMFHMSFLRFITIVQIRIDIQADLNHFVTSF